jgi:hypothetical protein
MIFFGRECDVERARPGGRLSYVRVDWVLVRKRWGVYVSERDQRVDGDFAIVFHDGHPENPWLMGYEKMLAVFEEEGTSWRPHRNHVRNGNNARLSGVVDGSPAARAVNDDTMDLREENLTSLPWPSGGVFFSRRDGRWVARLQTGFVRRHLSYHRTEQDAKRAFVGAHKACADTAWMWEGGPFDGFVDPLE